MRTNDVPFDHNIADYNLVWHHGLPIKTGQRKPGKDISGNLVPNGDFAQGRQAACPRTWQWQIKTPRAAAALVEEDGRRALRIEAAFDAAKPRDNYPIVVSREFAARPGHAYRIKARLKATAPEVKAGLMLQGYEANVYFWANWPNEITVGTDWKDHEFVFRIPGPGERGYHEAMKLFRARVDLPVAERCPPRRRRLGTRDRHAGRVGVVAGPGHGPALEDRRSRCSSTPITPIIASNPTRRRWPWGSSPFRWRRSVPTSDELRATLAHRRGPRRP